MFRAEHEREQRHGGEMKIIEHTSGQRCEIRFDLFLGGFLRFTFAPDLQLKLIALHTTSSHDNMFLFLYNDLLSGQSFDSQTSDSVQCKYFIYSDVYSAEDE